MFLGLFLVPKWSVKHFSKRKIISKLKVWPILQNWLWLHLCETYQNEIHFIGPLKTRAIENCLIFLILHNFSHTYVALFVFDRVFSDHPLVHNEKVWKTFWFDQVFDSCYCLVKLRFMASKKIDKIRASFI